MSYRNNNSNIAMANGQWRNVDDGGDNDVNVVT